MNQTDQEPFSQPEWWLWAGSLKYSGWGWIRAGGESDLTRDPRNAGTRDTDNLDVL